MKLRIKNIILLFFFLVDIVLVSAQRKIDLERLPDSARETILVHRARQILMQYGPGFYEKSLIPVVHRFRGTGYYAIQCNTNGQLRYKVCFLYDPYLEKRQEDYAAIVTFRAETGRADQITFRNGLGLNLDCIRSCLRKERKKGLREGQWLITPDEQRIKKLLDTDTVYIRPETKLYGLDILTRDSLLIAIAKEALLLHGPEYYRLHGQPTVKGRSILGHGSTHPSTDNYYWVSFPCDTIRIKFPGKEKSLAEVKINGDTGEVMEIRFANGKSFEFGYGYRSGLRWRADKRVMPFGIIY